MFLNVIDCYVIYCVREIEERGVKISFETGKVKVLSPGYNIIIVSLYRNL